MKSSRWAALALAMAPTPVIGAADPPPAWAAALPIERMCRATGALDHEFGSRDVPRQFMPSSLNPLPLDDAYAPFTAVKIETTKWSRRFHSAVYEAETASQEEAKAAAAAIAARFKAVGWIDPIAGSRYAGTDGNISLVSEPPGSEEGAMILLNPAGTKLAFSCLSVPLALVSLDEAFGHLAPGTPKPVLPRSPVPEGFDAAQCDDPAARAQFLAVSSSGTDPLTRYIDERMDFAERMITWKLDRLRDSGKISEDGIGRFLFGQFDTPVSRNSLQAGLEIFESMDEDVKAYGAATNGAESCRALVAILGKLRAIADATDPQRQAMEAAIDREAARLGVSLE
jgi:hypothetical protein